MNQTAGGGSSPNWCQPEMRVKSFPAVFCEMGCSCQQTRYVYVAMKKKAEEVGAVETLPTGEAVGSEQPPQASEATDTKLRSKM